MVSDNLIYTGLRCRILNVPLNRPIISRVGAFEKWAFICLDVETRGGNVGRSYLAPYLIDYAPAVAHCIETLAAPLKGQTIAPVSFFDSAMGRISLMSKSGIALYALAALDMALWDAHAKAAGMPLAVHLGGTNEPVKAYNSSGLWLSPVDELGTQAHELLQEGGFDAVKMRFGRSEMSEDIAAAAAVREAVGAGITVMSDFNQGLSFTDALHWMRALDDAGLYWFEEPINYQELASCAELCRQIKTPITLGENFHGPYDMQQALQLKACDMVMPDVMRIGGVTGWMRAAALAEQYGLDMSSHLFAEISAHLLRVTPTAHWLEWTDWANPILAEPFEVEDGHVVIPDVPGTGISWNEDALKDFAV